MGKADKRERKKNIIKKFLPNCYYNSSVYTYGNIPRSKFDGACSSYAGCVDYSDVLGLVDETVFGSGKKGMLFTDNGFYSSGLNRFYEYNEGISFNSLSDAYNLTAMNEMLNKLYEIDSEPSGWEVASSILGAAFDFLQAISEDTESESDDLTTKEVYKENYLDKQNLLETQEKEIQNSLDETIDCLDNVIDSMDEFDDNMEKLVEDADYCYDSLKTITIKIDNVLRTPYHEVIKPLEKLKIYLDSCKMSDGTIVEEMYIKIINLGEEPLETENELKKIAIRCRKKIKNYLIQLQGCNDEDEMEALCNMCKNDLRKYQKKIKEATIRLDDFLSEFS